jgi:thiaminase (transcriptional activator TenA)
MSRCSYEAWAAGRTGTRFTEWLRQQAEPAWSEATRHRFTRELADGILANTVMRRTSSGTTRFSTPSSGW